MTGSGPRRFFTAGVGEKRVLRDFAWRCDDFDRKLSPAVVELFRRELRTYDDERVAQGERRTWIEMRSLLDHYRYPKKKYDPEYHRPRNLLIGGLRMVLAQVGLESLQPDLIILDEFQRFAELLDTEGDNEDWTRRLARRLFSFEADGNVEATRVLLLSATPYRMYTHNLDADGDDHHADFLRTTRFLMDNAADPDAEVDALRHDLRRVRRSLFHGSDDQSLEEAKAASADVARRLRKVMVRTERLASTPDRNGMLTRVEMPDAAVKSGDVRSYLHTAALSITLGLADPVEMWKSAPYLVNFMEGYKLKQLLQDEDDSPGPDVVDLFGRPNAFSTRERWSSTDKSTRRTPDCAAWSPTLSSPGTGKCSGCRRRCRTTKREACTRIPRLGRSRSGSSSRPGMSFPRPSPRWSATKSNAGHLPGAGTSTASVMAIDPMG